MLPQTLHISQHQASQSKIQKRWTGLSEDTPRKGILSPTQKPDNTARILIGTKGALDGLSSKEKHPL